LIGPATSIWKGILDTRSKLFRSAGLLLLLFSCPTTEAAEEVGGAFPASDAWLKARFIGLRGEVRVRDEDRGGAAFARVEDRKASFALGGKGTASGEGVCGGLLGVKMLECEVVRFGGDNGDGDNGDLGDELGDFVTRRNFDGDLESDRLRDLTALVTSTWWTCVGEGNVSVPPPPFEYDPMIEVGMR
jgi:hypothetical protein